MKEYHFYSSKCVKGAGKLFILTCNSVSILFGFFFSLRIHYKRIIQSQLVSISNGLNIEYSLVGFGAVSEQFRSSYRAVSAIY